jgi:hypothetical protein
MEEVTTQETLADGAQLTPADGGGADQADSISLSALKEVLGKDFKSSESALKSIKDTFNYVGDVGKVKQVFTEAKTRLQTDDQGVLEALNKLMPQNEPVVPQPQGPTAQDVEAIINQRIDESTFFAENKNLADIKDVLKTLKDTHGKDMSWGSFAATDVAKAIVEPVIGYKEVQAKKSVLESNPRLGVASDKLSEAHKLVQEARVAAASNDVAGSRQALTAARENAVSSVIEAYEM